VYSIECANLELNCYQHMITKPVLSLVSATA
jgi:hypothetical protein